MFLLSRLTRQGLLVASLLALLGAVACQPGPDASQTAAADKPLAAKLQGVTVRFDYGGADKLLRALDQPVVSPAEAQGLLENRGVAAMVDNTAKYVPGVTRATFVSDAVTFSKTHKPVGDDYFGLDAVYQQRPTVRALLRELKQNEAAIIARINQVLAPYQPASEPLTVTVYFVAGGVSDGFVLDQDPEPAFFVALDKAGGDLDGVRQNMTHELYHVLQKAAARRVPAQAQAMATPATMAPPLRLLATTLWEGTANYAADASKETGKGAYLKMWRDRYLRNAAPARIAENFAFFDQVLAELRASTSTWDSAYQRGFMGSSDARFYFVGYEMAKALERYHGRNAIREAFSRPVPAFFQAYVALYRQHPELKMRFSPATEQYLADIAPARR